MVAANLLAHLEGLKFPNWLSMAYVVQVHAFFLDVGDPSVNRSQLVRGQGNDIGHT